MSCPAGTSFRPDLMLCHFEREKRPIVPRPRPPPTTASNTTATTTTTVKTSTASPAASPDYYSNYYDDDYDEELTFDPSVEEEIPSCDETSCTNTGRGPTP